MYEKQKNTPLRDAVNFNCYICTIIRFLQQEIRWFANPGFLLKLNAMRKLDYLAGCVVVFLLLGSCTKDEADKDSVAIQVTTSEPVAITANSAQILIELSGKGALSQGVCYATTPNPTTSDRKVEIPVPSRATATVTLIDLLEGIQYYARGYAVGPTETVYGQQVTFTTQPVASSVTTATVTAITETSARSGVTINKAGGVVTACGICWGESPAPTIEGNKTVTENPAGSSVEYTIPGLTQGTTYYVRSYATNQTGTSYGEERTFSTQHTIVNIPDANFHKYCLENFDTNKDGKIVVNEVRDVTYVNVSEKNISSLQGIEYFTALESLYCQYNKLTSLELSANIELVHLVCFDNQLKSLDVNKCIKLVFLNCGSNPLESLDVSKNTELTGLYCTYIQLKSLDVSKNVALKTLWCFGNQLKSLDVTKNTELTELSCGVNQLTSLDVSKNIELREFICAENQLTSLNVRQCTALETLHCERNKLTNLYLPYEKLRIFSCEENELTSLDVSLMKNLEELDCSSNKLTSLVTKSAEKLRIIDCSYNPLASHADPFYIKLTHDIDFSENPALETLYCQGLHVWEIDVSKCFKIKLVNVYNYYRADGVMVILPASLQGAGVEVVLPNNVGGLISYL